MLINVLEFFLCIMHYYNSPFVAIINGDNGNDFQCVCKGSISLNSLLG